MSDVRATPKREPKPFVPAPEPEDIDDEPLAEWECEGRCEWCLAYLLADGLCRCPGADRDARGEAAWQRYEEARD